MACGDCPDDPKPYTAPGSVCERPAEGGRPRCKGSQPADAAHRADAFAFDTNSGQAFAWHLEKKGPPLPVIITFVPLLCKLGGGQCRFV